jgi:hypothetical protein
MEACYAESLKGNSQLVACLSTGIRCGGGSSKECRGVECGTLYYSPNGVYYWGCGWFSSDPCSDGSLANSCDSTCVQAHNDNGGNLISCQSTGDESLYWLNWADCVCW